MEAYDHLEITASFFHQVTYVEQEPFPKSGHGVSPGRNRCQAIFYPEFILQTPQKRFAVFHDSHMAPQQKRNFGAAATTRGQKRFTD